MGDGPTETQVEAEDWLRTLHWSVLTPDGDPVDNLDDLASVLGVSRKEAATALLRLPFGLAAPDVLRAECEAETAPPKPEPATAPAPAPGAPVTEVKFRWDPRRHPRDRNGMFASIGATVKLAGGGGTGKVEKVVGGGRIRVRKADGTATVVAAHTVEVHKPGPENPGTRAVATATSAQRRVARPLNVRTASANTPERVDPRLARDAANAVKFPVGSKIETDVYGIDGKHDVVQGEVIGYKRGTLQVRTESHGNLAVEPAKARATAAAKAPGRAHARQQQHTLNVAEVANPERTGRKTPADPTEVANPKRRKAPADFKKITHGKGRVDGFGTVDDPIDVQGDIPRAAKLIAAGKHVRLNSTVEVGTLLGKLRDLVDDATKRGEKAPVYDLCRVSVPGTNLFCAQSKGIERVKMPQLSGKAVPGSRAAAAASEQGRVDATEPFLAALRESGIKVRATHMKASHLRASQSELNGATVAGIVKALEDGTMPQGPPIFVSQDGYIIDGHHRWAGEVAVDAGDGKLGDIDMPVIELGMDIGEALDYANAWTKDYGIAPSSVTKSGGHRVPPMSDAAYTKRSDQVAAALHKASADGLETHVKYTVNGDGTTWTPHRQAVHKEILDHLWAQGADVPNEGRGLFTGGLMGSGKSTMLGHDPQVDRSQYLMLNPDDIKTEMAARGLLPEVEGLDAMEASSLLHEESAYLAKVLAARAYAEKKNVIWDISMSSRSNVEKRLKTMREKGYGDIQALFVDIPVDVSVDRAMARHRNGMEDRRNGIGFGGRYVSREHIEDQRNAVGGSVNREVFDELQGEFDGWVIWDTSTTPPTRKGSHAWMKATGQTTGASARTERA